MPAAATPPGPCTYPDCPHSLTTMILQIIAVIFGAIWYVMLRPRKGGKNAPPTITSSSVCRIPVFGVLVEFFKSPNTMVKRCAQDYGSIFTIPVRVDKTETTMQSSFSVANSFSFFLSLDLSQALDLSHWSGSTGNIFQSLRRRALSAGSVRLCTSCLW